MPTMTDKWGRTPFNWASGYGRVEVVTVLLTTNADKTIKDPFPYFSQSSSDLPTLKMNQEKIDFD